MVLTPFPINKIFMIKQLIRLILRNSTEKKEEINIIYFGIFLFLLLIMTLFPFSQKEGIPLFFLIHALGQVLLEAGAFFLLAFALNRWAPRWLFQTFIGFSFAILVLHFTDFTILRLMDTPVSYIFNYLFGSGFIHLYTAFNALNMNRGFVVLIFISLALIPLLGIALYRLTQPLSKKIRWKIPLQALTTALLLICSGLFSLDVYFHPDMNRSAYEKFQKTLPLGKTFLSPQPHCIQLPAAIAPFREEAIVQKSLKEKQFIATDKPNIYLFIIETFRSDYITSEIAPSLKQFAADNLSFPENHANSNSTHPSWFTIFHADIPHHWTGKRDHWKEGSVPLQILKQLGYQIRVYSSADLRFFGMDNLLFGQNRKLVDQIEEHTEKRELKPYERDALCFQSFYRDLAKAEGKEGNLFVFFLDSTHSEYSFPTHPEPKFSPIVDSIDYLTITPNQLQPILNRYKNAISYVDTLMGYFFDQLKKDHLYDQAIIAITGDHGEEFFEEGALFHGTHLNRYQTSVPLFYKFQQNPWSPQTTTATHLDIFPSILHYLTGQTDFVTLFDGQSLFAPNRWPHRIAVLQNGHQPPVEFAIETTTSRHHCRFHPTESQTIELLSPLDVPFDELTQVFGPLLNKQ